MQAETRVNSDLADDDQAFSMAQKPDYLARVTPILFGMVVGMLIMLLVVYFFPKDYKQADNLSVVSPPVENVTASGAQSGAVQAPPLAPSAGSLEAAGYTIQTVSTTQSGYPVCVNNPSRAIDSSGIAPTPNGNVSIAPEGSSYVIEASPQVSTSPCVDPPSSRGPMVRYAPR